MAKKVDRVTAQVAFGPAPVRFLHDESGEAVTSINSAKSTPAAILEHGWKRPACESKRLRHPNLMSTVTKIETAIKQFAAQKVEELATWLDEYRQTLHASDATFALCDEEEKL